MEVNYTLRNSNFRAGGLSHQFKALVTFAKDSVSVHGSLMGSEPLQSLLGSMPSSDRHGHQAHIWFSYIHAGKTLIQIKNIREIFILN